MSLEVTRIILIDHIGLKWTTNSIRMINVNNGLKQRHVLHKYSTCFPTSK